MGHPLPVGTHPQSLPSVPNEPDWDAIPLDGLSTSRASQILADASNEEEPITTRGAKEIGLYKQISPNVVLVVANDESNSGSELGSGTYIGPNLILTNWHVVQGSNDVWVLFKPTHEGGKINPAAFVQATVIKANPIPDLALLKVSSVPTYVHPVELGTTADIQVGADVLAIGHPLERGWTYTRGMISQISRDYDWADEKYPHHHANVIQTQTPINRGNSGGPLLSDSGRLVGVNTFKDTRGEGLNFAVSVDSVNAFLQSPSQWTVPSKTSKQACSTRKLYEGRDQANTGGLIQYDTNCDGKADFALSVPDDKSKPIEALIDSNYDGNVDIVVYDTDRDGKWDISFHDVDFNGTIDLVGYHPDGKITPSRYETYKAYVARLNLAGR
jgi:S1-C subfamily serine protease